MHGGALIKVRESCLLAVELEPIRNVQIELTLNLRGLL